MGTTENEMVACHYWLNGLEFEQAPGHGDGQGSLVCCSPWGHKDSRYDWVTEQQQQQGRSWSSGEHDCTYHTSHQDLIHSSAQNIWFRHANGRPVQPRLVINTLYLRPAKRSNIKCSKSRHHPSLCSVSPFERSNSLESFDYILMFGLPWWLRW